MTYSLLATLRYDPFLETLAWNNEPNGSQSPYLLLSHQLDRLVECSRASGWVSTDDLTLDKLRDVCNAIRDHTNGDDARRPLKIRVVVSSSGDITTSASPILPLQHDPTLPSLFRPDADVNISSDPALRIWVDTQPSATAGSMKTTSRRIYDDARVRAGMPPLGTPSSAGSTSDCPDDVMLYNIHNAVTETSICNIAFYRRSKWITPPLAAGCISGVLRRWLLENHRIHEAAEDEISLSTIKDNEWVLVFNGVMGCRLGRLQLQRVGTPK